MNWSSIGELAAMGGYAAYVWGAIGMVPLLAGAEVVLVGRRWRRAQAAPRLARQRDSA